MIRWMNANGRDVPRWLAVGGLEYLCDEMRERPVPLLKVFDLFRTLARQEGPGICARVITDDSIGDLGVFGAVILGSRTPRDALSRVQHVLPRYSTHEIVTLRLRPAGMRVLAGWSLVLDDETLHLTQQYTAALIVGLCMATGRPNAVPGTIRIRPHPEFGLKHLRPIFGNAVAASDEPTLTVDLDDAILDSSLRFSGCPSGDPPVPEWVMPKGDSSFSSSVYLTLQALSADKPVTLDQIAALAGMSVRSFQRALTQEGSSFRTLLDDFRRAQVLATLPADPRVGRLVAADLGYSGQSSMSRAVRRWTGKSPREMKTIVAASIAKQADR